MAGLSLFWRFQLAGWAAFVAVTFPLKVELMGSIPGAFLLCVIRDGSSIILTLGMREIYQKFWSNNGRHMAVLIIAVCSLGGLLQSGLFFLLHPFVSSEGEIFSSRVMAFSALYERTGLLYGWSFLYFGIRQAVEGMKRELRLALAESAQRGAEIQMLRAQMSPHFLFNALNTIRAGVEKSDSGLGSMVQSLADFLRFSLDHSKDELVPLGLEFDAMQDFLAVERAQLGDKLEFHCEIGDAARAVAAPGIILQPLVENAVKYGQDTSDLPLRVSIHVSLLDVDTVQIVVGNSGYWVEPAPREKESHLGLQNLRRRLSLLYPDLHRFDIGHTKGWVTISIQIPIL